MKLEYVAKPRYTFIQLDCSHHRHRLVKNIGGNPGN